MSELGLGVADGESRWIGVRRHQAALAIIGLGFVGEWVTHAHGSSMELVVGIALLSCSSPTSDGLTVGERVRIAGEFLLRSRWTSISTQRRSSTLSISARGESTVCAFELLHRGRLDLAGLDLLNASSLADFADTLATSKTTRHFSLHVLSSPSGVATLLAVPPNVSAPPGWTENVALALGAVHADDSGGAWLLERWSYVRVANQVIRVLRVRDFSAVPEGHALLEQLQFASPWLDVVLHVDVVGGVRATRLTARAVHRVGSDDATSQSAGFRRTAQSTRTLERLRQRESLVVEGAALLRIAVFVVVRAASLRQLRRDVKSVTQGAFEAGLRCETGPGRQSLWYCAQLPGAPGW